MTSHSYIARPREINIAMKVRENHCGSQGKEPRCTVNGSGSMCTKPQRVTKRGRVPHAEEAEASRYKRARATEVPI